jgi:IMP dehydrogenase/GMP reductase
MQYNLNEICLLPSATPTTISSRSQVNTRDFLDRLPIFVAPMTSVINETNYKEFLKHDVIPVLPRGRHVSDAYPSFIFNSYSLTEIEEGLKNKTFSNKDQILIDVANGHMLKIYDLAKQLRKEWPMITIMVGNIAHPDMYRACVESGVNYVRVGIGGGSACTTSVQTGIHASHVWLIEGIKRIRKDYVTYNPNVKLPAVIADGGINTIDKAIKCLALGYDYVMMGYCFAKCKEACGITSQIEHSPVITRTYYGMASEQGQIDISGGIKKNPEGTSTTIIVDTTLEEFINQFEAALRSAMSYVGAMNLHEFKNNTQWDIMSYEEFKSYYK